MSGDPARDESDRDVSDQRESTRAAPAPRRGSRTRRRIVGVVVLLVGTWIAVAAWQLWSAQRTADAALHDLEELRGSVGADVDGFVDALVDADDDLAEETAASRLDEAAAAFADVRRDVRSPVVSPLRALPVIGRQIRSVDALSTSAGLVAREGAAAFRSTADAMNAGSDDAASRLAASRALEDALVELDAGLVDLDLGPADGLVGPLQEARATFVEEYERFRVTLDRTITATAGANEFLEGPSTYLLLGANNAEARAGGGMYLQIGLLDVEQGRFEVRDLSDAAAIFVPDPVVAADADLQANWGQLLPTQEWRNLNLTPRFDATAPLAADMWQARGGEPVDGVLVVDVVALSALLGVTGPIEIDGQEITDETVQQDLFLDQYVDFDDRSQRRERLGDVAEATFLALNDRSWSPSALLGALERAGAGRHLLAWSRSAAPQEAWAIIGIDGALGRDSLLLSVLNRGGTKLDPYLDVTAALTVGPEQDGLLEVRVEVGLVNTAPEDLPNYVQGPHPRSVDPAGTYRGIVALTMPGAAGDPSVDGDVVLVADDGPTRVLAAEVVVPRGGQATVGFSFVLPETAGELVVQPSGRVPPVLWSYEGDTWEDDHAERIPTDAP